MVTAKLQTQVRLNSRGYSAGGIELTYGWQDYGIPLYTHKQLAHRQVGDVAFKARVQDPRSLTSAEADYIARKGAQGFYAWPPNQCFEHEFTPVEIVQRPGGGYVQQKAETQVFGCKWCRDKQPNGLAGVVEDSPVSSAGSAGDESSAPSPVTLTQSGVFACEEPGCGYVASETSKAGKPKSDKQRVHELNLHIKRAHSGK